MPRKKKSDSTKKLSEEKKILPVDKETPLMRQYNKIKEENPGAILLFRVGDFYETFGEDAKIASKILNITLTYRGASTPSEIELAGFPHHAIDTYMPKLVRAGYRVAVCEQLENPKDVKGIVKRGVTEIVTPGLAFSDSILDKKQNNYLASVFMKSCDQIGISFLDISTGEFFLSEGNVDYIKKLIEGFNPSEIILCKKEYKSFEKIFGDQFNTYTLDEWIYNFDYGEEALKAQFKVASLKSFGIDKKEAGIISAGAILRYLEVTEHKNIAHINSVSLILDERYLWMDNFTISSLELVRPAKEDGCSLLEILDETHTPMGGRLLVKWMLFPLKSAEQINERLSIVEYFLKESLQTSVIKGIVKQIGDLERLIVKFSTGRVSPREVIALEKSLSQISPLKRQLQTIDLQPIKNFYNFLADFTIVIELIKKTIVEAPPALSTQGGLIKMGVNKELDSLRSLSDSGKDYLAEIQKSEAKKNEIPSLKVGYNKIFGYYLEVTNTHKNKVPETWIRKQTLSNAERYVTEDLKKYEDSIINAEHKATILEEEIFRDVISRISQYITQIKHSASIVAELDCLLSFAQKAEQADYYKPIVKDSTELYIKGGRHPVIEHLLSSSEEYVKNDISLNQEDQQIAIITGPNMSGKSAILRQTALITIMAQMGSYVPADSAHLGVIDKIFTRVGASDNIARGESTFMIEMIETATIMNNFTNNSLILMDEIGRGTSTYDGLSIATSVVEYLHNGTIFKPKTLFATHYHELNNLESYLKRVKTFHVSVREKEGTIWFLRKLLSGGTSHSFGINVAVMAGMPREVIARAEEILVDLEKNKNSENIENTLSEISKKKYQLSIIDLDPKYKKVKNFLTTLNINTMPPIEALLKINELKKIMEEEY